MIVFDTDIISALAKAEALDEVLNVFSDAYIAPAVYFELKRSLDVGYTYPQHIFDRVKIIDLTPEERELFQEFALNNKKLGSGELESIAVCAKRELLFSSFDKHAIKFAKENNAQVFLLKAILKTLLTEGICSPERIKEIIKLIEVRDRRSVDSEGVFD